MNFLLTFREDGREFGTDWIHRALSELSGIHDLVIKDSIGAVLICGYDFENDSTIIRFKDDYKTLSIDGAGEASVSAAFELQRRLGVPLRLVDSDYSFDLKLSDFRTLDELRQAIQRGNDSASVT